MDLKAKVRVVADFPKEGISFKDVTTLLEDGPAYAQAIDQMIAAASEWEYDVIVGPEARGFLVGAPMAVKTGKGFVPIRKPGKLPYKTLSYEYDLEYGTDTLQIHEGSIKPGQRVLIADDLLATGGTVGAVKAMIEQMGGIVTGAVFLMELMFLPGREKLGDTPIASIIQYED